MRISSLPVGDIVELNKWYYCFELRKCPYSMVRVFRPWLRVALFKVLDAGELGRLGGRPRIERGGFRDFTFPFGIFIEIIK